MWLGFQIVSFLYRVKHFPEKLLFQIFHLLQPLFKKDRYILADSLHDNYAECIDTYALFLYMQKIGLKCNYVICKNNTSYKKIKTETNLKNLTCLINKHYFLLGNFWNLLHAHTIISSFGCGVEKTDKFFTQNCYINNIYLNHGISFLKLFVLKNNYTPDRFNYFLVSNSLEEKMLLKETDWKQSNLIKSGLFRFDLLKKENHLQKNIFIMFTWRRALSEDNYQDSLYFKRLNSFLNNNNFLNLAFTNNISINIALHHSLISKANICFESILEKPYINIVPTNNISKYISKTDLFITDFSSVVFDFMYLNIPVIFYRLDADHPNHNYLERESILYAKNKDEFLYNCFYNEKDTIEKIEYYINTDFQLETIFKEKNNQFFDYIEKGNIRKNFIEKITNIRKEVYK